jgi:hypothetical protein
VTRAGIVARTCSRPIHARLYPRILASVRLCGFAAVIVWVASTVGCRDAPSDSSTLVATSAPATAATPQAKPASELPLPARDTTSLPAEFRELVKSAATSGREAKYSVYSYRYATSGARAAAIFIPRPVPRDDTVLVGAISDLVRRVYRVDLSAVSPGIESRPLGNVIAFDAPRHSYYVLTVKNETREGEYGPGEPHTFMVWRETRRASK